MDASMFGQEPGAPHQPVVMIGSEAREVVHDPERILAVYVGHVVFEGGLFAHRLELPQASGDIPDGAFVLSVRRAKKGASGVIEPEIVGYPYAEIKEGWRIARDAARPKQATLELDETPEDRGKWVSLRLEAFAPSPALLASRPFDLPANAVIELAYGLTHPGSLAGKGPIRFSAAVHCSGAPARELLSEVIDPERAPGHWHEARLIVEGKGGRCTLHLSSADQAVVGGGPVWAAPRIYAGTRRAGLDLPNVVLISLDTLAADHMSAYGYVRETTPQIDRMLVREGLTFTDVSTTFPRTDRAHLGLFTGLYPSALPDPRFLASETPVQLLAEALRDAGFDTAAVAEGLLVAGARGFWFGFDRFIERHPVGGKAEATFADGIRFLHRLRQRRFFLFLHTYETHGPYHVPSEYQALFNDEAADQRPATRPNYQERLASKYDDYDRVIRKTDDIVAGFLEALEELGLAERTLVILLSDHGEAYAEHGAIGHGNSAHREELRVPLILRGPGVPVDRRVPVIASLVDVSPTLLDMLELPPLRHAQGESLLPTFNGASAAGDRTIYFEWLNSGLGVRRGPFKLMLPRSGAGRLYHVVDDPWEKKPLAGRPALRRRLREDAQRYKREAIRVAEDLESVPFSEPDILRNEDLRDLLRAIGDVE